jgi:maltose-binding protein MalE
MRQALAALAGGTAYPAQPEFQYYLAPLDAALQAALRGNTPPAEALSAAEQAIRAILEQMRATATPSP